MRAFTAGLLAVAGVHAQAGAAEFTGPRVPSAWCRPAVDGCTCSIESSEPALSFAEVVGLIEIHYGNFPDEAYERLLVKLLRECSAVEPTDGRSSPQY